MGWGFRIRNYRFRHSKRKSRTLVNGATTAPGKVGNAFSFDGIDDFVQVPDSNSWTFGSNDFSITLWANFSTVDTGSRDQLRNVFVGHDSGSGPGNKWIFFYAETGLFFHIFDMTEGIPIFLGPFAFTPVVGQFHHFAVTRSGSTYTFYADGAAIGSTIDSRPIPNATAPLTIGQSEGVGFFHGLIDEVQIYNRALSQEEIQSIFLGGSVVFLHGSGPNANPAVLFLDSVAPTSSTAKYRDSSAIKFSGGNPWKLVGTWTAEPEFFTGSLTTLSDLRVWLGLKNSDDQGTRFDLAAEVWKNGTLVAEGETLCITGVTRNPALAKRFWRLLWRSQQCDGFALIFRCSRSGCRIQREPELATIKARGLIYG